MRSPSRLRPPRQQRLNFLQQPRELYRLGVEVVAAGGKRLLAFADHRVRGERDDRNAPRLRRAFQSPGRLPSIHDRETQIHEDQIRMLRIGECDALCAIGCGQDRVTEASETLFDHVDVVLVVFDVENLHAGSAARLRALRSTSTLSTWPISFRSCSWLDPLFSSTRWTLPA